MFPVDFIAGEFVKIGKNYIVVQFAGKNEMLLSSFNCGLKLKKHNKYNNRLVWRYLMDIHKIAQNKFVVIIIFTIHSACFTNANFNTKFIILQHK